MQDLSREIPYGELAIIGTHGTEQMLERIQKYIGEWRKEEGKYIIKTSLPRFGTGEGKCLIAESVRGKDVFILADCYNYNVTYKMRGIDVPTSPDEHFCDLKRIISAIGGKAKRISVVMPMLYSSRQHRVGGRESLDCAQALADLASMGVDNIMTFDAHDDRVRNAIPLKGFDNLMPTYQMLKSFFSHESDIDKNNLMIVSPDEGALSRGMYYSEVLGTQLSMFYKKRDYSVVHDGRNPIKSHEYLGDDVNGKDLIVVDDIASSGESFLHILDKLKNHEARRIFGFCTFGLFCNGLETMDRYYKEGMFDKVYTTNTIYNSPELLSREWYVEVNLLKYIAYYIEAVNINRSISTIIDPFEKIKTLIASLDNHNM